MKKTTVVILLSTLIFAACGDKTNAPDVSNITVSFSVQRFDQDFFQLDSNSLEEGFSSLQKKYPDFLGLYLQNIVGVNDEAAARNFFRLYKPVYDSSQKIYANFGLIQSRIEKGFRYVKYYFPNYKTPARIIPIIGPMNTHDDLAKMSNGDYTPDFIGPDFLGISLQFYLGADFSLYQQEYFINNVVPLFRSRRFTPDYIPADAMKLIVDDIFPDKSNTLPLIDQMIQRGKQWWLLDKFLPSEADSVKTGYTKEQLDWCNQNEGLIWSQIIKNEDLRAIDPPTIQTYLGEGPFTQGFSQESSPGNIGTWIGRQIVRKFAANNPNMKPEDVMKADPRTILDEARYKPK